MISAKPTSKLLKCNTKAIKVLRKVLETQNRSVINTTISLDEHKIQKYSNLSREISIIIEKTLGISKLR